MRRRQTKDYRCGRLKDGREYIVDPKGVIHVEWRGRLGWRFSAEECMREHYFKMELMQSMRQPEPKREVEETAEEPVRRFDGSELLDTQEAILYVRGTIKTLQLGRKLRILHPQKKDGNNLKLYYRVDELNTMRLYERDRIYEKEKAKLKRKRGKR